MTLPLVFALAFALVSASDEAVDHLAGSASPGFFGDGGPAVRGLEPAFRPCVQRRRRPVFR